MTFNTQNAFILIASICSVPVLSSAYYNNDFFTRISKDEVNTYWTNEIDAHSFIKESFSCELAVR